jgi:hypothetical protein
MNKTYEVHRLKILNINEYAVSGKRIKSKKERCYTWGGAGTPVRTHKRKAKEIFKQPLAG